MRLSVSLREKKAVNEAIKASLNYSVRDCVYCGTACDSYEYI